MIIRRILASLWLLIVILCGIWLVNIGDGAFDSLIPDDDYVVIVAAPGANLTVVPNGMKMHQGDGWIESWSPATVPLTVVPFAIILLTAIAGCFSWFWKSGRKSSDQTPPSSP